MMKTIFFSYLCLLIITLSSCNQDIKKNYRQQDSSEIINKIDDLDINAAKEYTQTNLSKFITHQKADTNIVTQSFHNFLISNINSPMKSDNWLKYLNKVTTCSELYFSKKERNKAIYFTTELINNKNVYPIEIKVVPYSGVFLIDDIKDIK